MGSVRGIIRVMAFFDVILVLPYTFTDHPSFPEALIKGALEDGGFSVGVIETPFWQNKEPFAALGRPRLFFAIVSGPVDSVLLNYTATRKRRREDLYQLGGKACFQGGPRSISQKIRPDRTIIVFANRLREAFRGVPVVIGGIEASLRAFAHYDLLENRIRRSILLDSRASLAVMGMGEKQVVSLARIAKAGGPIEEARVPGTARISNDLPDEEQIVLLPSLKDIQEEPGRLLEAQILIQQGGMAGKRLAQAQGERFVLAEPPQSYSPLDLDAIYGRAYSRTHPGKKLISPALQMNLFSITTHRGCCGGCTFCAIEAHQGRRVITRSPESILREAHGLGRHPRWRGYVSDLGGPSAEMAGLDCQERACTRPSCLFPKPCPRLAPVKPFLDLLRAIRKQPHIKKVFLGSGIRYDLFLEFPELLEEILVHHAGPFLRIAPEHTQDHVLALMQKPGFASLEAFVRLFRSISRGLKRSVVLKPYLMVGHPGETLEDVQAMLRRLKALSLPTTDVQIFTPSPGTLSTAMYYAEQSPLHRPLAVEKGIRALMERKALLTEQQAATV